MDVRFRATVLAACVGALLASPRAAADYFADQHMYLGRVKTEYLAANEGTVTNPVTLGPSLYPCDPNDPHLVAQPCDNTNPPTVWSQSNSWSANGAVPGGKYWVLLNNNEPWWVLPQNSGPPDQSMPRVDPGTGVYGFSMIPYTLGGKPAFQAHLVLNNNFANLGSVPFMSIGADVDRGNGTVLGALNDPARPNSVKFTAKVWDYTLGYDGVLGFQLWAVANWGGKPRMIFLHLFTHEIAHEYVSDKNHSHWSWRVTESSLAPGADVAYADAAVIAQWCPGVNAPAMTSLGETRTYVINLQKLYECASADGLFDAPMPTNTVVPIETVGFSNEMAGSGFALWTSVYDVTMQLGNVGCQSCLHGGGTLLASEPAAETTGQIRAAFLASCLANRECAQVTGPYVARGERPPVTRTPGKTVPYARMLLKTGVPR